MARATLGGIFESSAKIAEKKARLEAETPAAETPEAIRAAGRNYRRFEVMARRPGEPDVQDIIKGEHGALFKKFLKEKHGVEIDEEIKERELGMIAGARVEFLEAVHHAEYIKGLISVEVIQKVITAGINKNSFNFKNLVDTMNPETLAKVVKDQMIEMAVSNPTRFESFSNDLEKAALYKETKQFRGDEEHANETFKTYKISDKRYHELVEAIDSAPSDEELELLQKQVRTSKGIFGFIQLYHDWQHKKNEKKVEKAEDYISQTERAQDRAQRDLDDILRDLPALQREASAYAADPEHDAHRHLAVAEARQSILEERLTDLDGYLTEARDMLAKFEEAAEASEERSSRSKAEELKERIEEAREAKGRLDDQMEQVGTTLQLVMDGTPAIREVVQKLHLGQTEKEHHVELTPRERREFYRAFENHIPSDPEWNTRFDTFVGQARLAEDETPREKLKNRFKSEEKERLAHEYKRQSANDLPIFGFVSSLLFAAPGVGIGSKLDTKKLT